MEVEMLSQVSLDLCGKAKYARQVFLVLSFVVRRSIGEGRE